MSTGFVTIATYGMPPPAHLALGLLQESGITALLRNEELVAGAWDLGQASRGVEVQVPREDARRARDIVEQAKFRGGVAAPVEWGENDAADGGLTQAQREDLIVANRALRAAVFGILFGPLQIYSLWLLYTLSSSGRAARRTPIIRQRMRTAFVLDLWVAIGLMVLAYLSVGAALLGFFGA